MNVTAENSHTEEIEQYNCASGQELKHCFIVRRSPRRSKLILLFSDSTFSIYHSFCILYVVSGYVERHLCLYFMKARIRQIRHKTSFLL